MTAAITYIASDLRRAQTDKNAMLFNGRLAGRGDSHDASMVTGVEYVRLSMLPAARG